MDIVRTTGAVALVFASVANAISLSQFTPKVDGLPSPCNDVYNRQIIGCIQQDFAQNQNTRCSSNCVNGLIEIQKALTVACKDVDVAETSIVGVFLSGNGIPALCRGVTVTTVSSSGAAQTSTQQQQSSRVQQSSVAQSSSSDNQQSSTTQAAATTAVNIPPAAGIPPTTAAQPQQSFSSKASSTATAQGQKSNKDSGGGSPFDVQSSGGVERPLVATSMGVMIGFIMLLCAIL